MGSALRIGASRRHQHTSLQSDLFCTTSDEQPASDVRMSPERSPVDPRISSGSNPYAVGWHRCDMACVMYGLFFSMQDP